VARDFDIDVETRGLADLYLKFERMPGRVNKEYFEYARQSAAPSLRTKVKQEIWYSGIRPDSGELRSSWYIKPFGSMATGTGATGSSGGAKVYSLAEHAEYLTTGVPPHSIPKSGKMPPGKFMVFDIKESKFAVTTIGDAEAEDATRTDIPYGTASYGDPPKDLRMQPLDVQEAVIRNAKRKVAQFYRDGFIFAKQVDHPGVIPYDYVDRAVAKFIALDWKKSRAHPLRRALLESGFTPSTGQEAV